MGFIDEKDDLFNEISATKVITQFFPELNKSFTNFDSVKSKDGNLIELLLDLLKNLVDSSEIKSQLSRLISEVDSWEEEIKSGLISNIMETYTKNFNFNLPQGTILSTSLKNIDLNDKLKINDQSFAGNFYYGDNNTDFTKFLKTSLNNGSGTWKGILDVNYVGSDVVEVAINQGYSNKSFEDLIFDMFNSGKLIDTSMLLTQVTDSVFGCVSSINDSGYDWLLDQLKTKELIDKIISKEALKKDNETITYDNSFFEFSSDELQNIRKKAQGMQSGDYLTDLGCGVGSSFVDLGFLNDSLGEIRTLKPSLIKEKVNSVLDEVIDQSSVDISDENKKNVEFNLISEIFKNLPAILMNFILSPKIITVYQLAESLINGSGLNQSTTIPSGIDFTNQSLESSRLENFFIKMKETVVCMVKIIYKMIVEFLFNVVKSKIIELTTALYVKILTDQTSNYYKILKTSREILKTVNNIFSLING